MSVWSAADACTSPATRPRLRPVLRRDVRAPCSRPTSQCEMSTWTLLLLSALVLTLQAPAVSGQPGCAWLSWHPALGASGASDATLDIPAPLICAPPGYITDFYADPVINGTSSGIRSLSAKCSDGSFVGSSAAFSGNDTAHLRQALVHSTAGFVQLNGSADATHLEALGQAANASHFWTDACPTGLRVAGFQSSQQANRVGHIKLFCGTDDMSKVVPPYACDTPAGAPIPLLTGGNGPALGLPPLQAAPPAYVVFALQWTAAQQVSQQDMEIGIWGMQLQIMENITPLGHTCLSDTDLKMLLAKDANVSVGCFQSGPFLSGAGKDLISGLTTAISSGKLKQTLADVGLSVNTTKLLFATVANNASLDPDNIAPMVSSMVFALPPSPAASSQPIIAPQKDDHQPVAVIAVACVTAGILASALLGIIVIALIMRRQRRRAAQGELIGKQSIPSSGASSHHTTGTVTPVSPAAFSAMELGGAVPFAARPPLGSGPGVSSPTTRPTTPGTPQDYPLWMWTAQPPVSPVSPSPLTEWLTQPPFPGSSQGTTEWGQVLHGFKTGMTSGESSQVHESRARMIRTAGAGPVQEETSSSADSCRGQLNPVVIKTGSGRLEDWEIQPEDLQICQQPDGQPVQLGAGGFGLVYKAVLNEVTEVAVKQLEASSAAKRALFSREIEIHKRCHSAHVVQFLGACIKSDCMMLVMELMHESLDMVVHDEERPFFWQPHARQIALDVAQALAYLHKQRVVHLDIKSRNVLLTKEGRAKIADVGLSQVLEHTYLSQLDSMGTFAYAAPELLSGGSNCSTRADIWSYGILLHEMVTREHPKRGALCDRQPHQCPKLIDGLIQRCLERDPGDRPSAKTIVKVLQAGSEAEAEIVLLASMREDSLPSSKEHRSRRTSRGGRSASAPSLERNSV